MDQLEIIRRTIEEHHKIRGNIRLIGEATNDMEALFSLQQAEANWGQSSIQSIVQNVDKLKQTIHRLSEGLKNHFALEEQWLPPVLGDNLAKALVLEHDEIRDKLVKCEAGFVNDISEFQRDKLLSYRTSVEQVIDDLIGLIEGHAGREDIVLSMIEKALSRERRQ